MWSKIKSKWYGFLWWVSGPHAGRLYQEWSKEFLYVHNMLMEEKDD